MIFVVVLLCITHILFVKFSMTNAKQIHYLIEYQPNWLILKSTISDIEGEFDHLTIFFEYWKYCLDTFTSWI